ncbi:hypothetical protein CJF30_00005149 [Rutstroemia sp. NJR-2017a BBW]|nr:hypothetical protein CJF30_00005149 [Rutstroemia sp. NJR-2017a BBW]
MDSDDTPIFRLEELEAHLKELVASPDVPLDKQLFDAVELQLTDYNISPLIPRLLPNITQILLTTQQDPTPLASLSVKLLQPISFSQALSLASEDALVLALRSPVPAANILAITIIEKASKSPGHVATLSNMKVLIENLVRTWLSNPDVGVGEKATQALGALLDTDCDHRASITRGVRDMDIDDQKPPGQGLLWRRLFQDQDVYEMFFALCSSKSTAPDEDRLDEKQKSLAQARLLRLLPRLGALDARILCHSSSPDVDRRYVSPGGEPGLLYFAAMEMVDKEDLLMHMTLTIFFLEFLEAISTTDISGPTKEYIASMLRRAMRADLELRQSVEGAAMSQDSSPELIALILSLNRGV